MHRLLRPLAFVGLTAGLVLPLTAQQRPTSAPAPGRGNQEDDRSGDSAAVRRGPATAPERDIIKLTEQPPAVQRRSIHVRGQNIGYTSQTGMLPIRTADGGAIEGGMFYIAYTREGANPSTRPITFVFNGGPGSSSVWLHLGAWGPKRVRLMPDGDAPPPPYMFEDNPHTLLDQTDMVFIDPIGTGYSRAASQQLGARFWGLDEDLRSVAEFVRLYLTRFDRMGSPKFLAGESYGTTRAAGLSGVLAGQGITLNGILLISTVLNFGYQDQRRGNDLGFINFLPTYTATAWFHKQLPDDLQRLTLDQATRQAEQWAMGAYASALMKGNKLTGAEHAALAEQMARFTGLSTEFIRQNDLRVTLGAFNAELLRDQQRQVGRLDSRFTGFAPLLAGGGGGGPGGGGGVGDPSMSIIRNTFTPVFTDYARRELNYKSDDTYYILGGGIGPWNYPQNQYATVVPQLERALAINPYMRVFVAEGYFDGATPFFASQYTFSHMSVDPAVARNNFTFARYAAGHMMYIDEPSARTLRTDLQGFYNAATRMQAVP